MHERRQSKARNEKVQISAKLFFKDRSHVRSRSVNLRDPGEKGENFKAVILPQKSIVSMQSFTGSLMVLFSSFCMTYFCQKKKRI